MQRKGLKGTSTVTGIIDGLGSMGTSLGQLVIGHAVDAYDWKYGYLLVLSLAASTTAIPLCWPRRRELKEIRRD